MTCYICRNARGVNKEECMFASNPNEPGRRQMAYHEVSEYSSNPPTIVPPKPDFGSTDESKKVEEVKKAPIDYDFDY